MAKANADPTFAKSKALQAVAHALIPGGAHTYAKGDDQYPELAPACIAKGAGCRVWDVDGNEFIGAVAAALGVYRRALEDGVHRYLVGRPVLWEAA